MTIMISRLCLLLIVCVFCDTTQSFTLVMMGCRRGRGSLKRILESSTVGDSSTKDTSVKSLNAGKGQEITGVTLPSEGKIKGWEFGNKVQLACANVGGDFFALQGDCPRCAFELYKGDLILYDNEAFEDLPRVACPTCSTTYSLISGEQGPPLKRKGLAGFVNNMAKQATMTDATKDAKAFIITRDVDGRVYCKER